MLICSVAARSSRYALIGALALVSCSPSSERRPNDARAAVRVGGDGDLEWEARLNQVERYVAHDERIDAVAFRSGGGVTSLLSASPAAAWGIMLEPPHVPQTGGPYDPADRKWRDDNPPLGAASDIVGVTPDGVTWYLDSASGRVVSHNVAATSHIEATLDTLGAPRSGCVIEGRAIAFIENAHPETVFVKPLSPASRARALAIPRGYVDGRAVKWRDVHFGGSLGAPGVMWAPRMRTAMVVSDSAVRALGEFIEPVIQEPWYRSMWYWMTRTAPVYARDATSYPGGVAVLFAGNSAGADRMVDLYADSGAYLQTLVLPRRALRVAGNGERIYVLSQRLDSILLSSYILPWSIRRWIRHPAIEPVDARPDPRWVRELHGGL